MSWCLVGSEMCIRDRFFQLLKYQHFADVAQLARAADL
jgi:hypothetical protein